MLVNHDFLWAEPWRKGEKEREKGHLSCLWTFSANGAREVFRKREPTHKENEQGRDAKFFTTCVGKYAILCLRLSLCHLAKYHQMYYLRDNW